MNSATAVAPEEGLDRFDRATIQEAPAVDPDGGQWGAGIIRGVSLASVGEALGHQAWLDERTIEQVVELSQAKDVGLKSRFTHPSMSSDGMGRYLGRIFNVRQEGDKAVGDLHLAKSAHDTPEGDLAEYVMMLTQDDPKAAGLSIVFEHDGEKESLFMESFTNEHGAFLSPDARNESNYPHVRIKELRASDVVDEPAANPDGLFDRSPVARDADAFLSYAAGIAEAKPDVLFGFDGDRAKQFFTRWLNQHGLTIGTLEESSDMENEQPEVTRESILAEQSRFVDQFGAELGVQWFTEGKSYENALELYVESQNETAVALQSRIAELEEKISSLSVGEEPIETYPEPEGQKKVSFADYVTGQTSQN